MSEQRSVAVHAEVRDDRSGLLTFLPTGLWLGGALAAARAWLSTAPPAGFESADVALLRWGVLQSFPTLLSEGLLAGVTGSLLLVLAAERRSSALRFFGWLVAALVALAYLAGYPPRGGAPAQPGLEREVWLLAVGAATLAALLAHAGELTRGRLAFATALLVAVVAPLVAARLWLDAPEMERRLVVADVVASVDSWSVVEQRPGVPPIPMTITPVVDLHADVADKPAIRMAPPCAVAFDVPAEAGVCTLRAAAGADLSVVERLPQHLTQLEIDYSVEVDGEVAWSERIAHKPMPLGTWAPELFRWRHAGGDAGIEVRPGQRVVLRTAFAAGRAPEGLDEKNGLNLGFGGVLLERRVSRPRATARPDAPNIVFVVMDTQRADRLGCYGHRRPVSPNIDALAAGGTLFENAYATSSWTWPSTASLLTGMLPDEHGVTGNERCTLAYAHVTLAEALQARGYTCAAFSGNPLIVEARQFDQGFETFDGSVPDFRMSDELVPPALDWLRRHASARFFLYLHLVDPHTPHRPHPEEAARLGLGEAPSGWPEIGLDGVPAMLAGRTEPLPAEMRRYMSELYDASVATGDRWFGELYAELARLGLLDRTVICFTSDHGEGLLDHGMVGHGNSVYVEETRVPLIFSGPGVERGLRVPGTVSNHHAAPTLASFGGTDLPLREVDRHHLLDGAAPGSAVYLTRRGVRGLERGLVLYGIREGHWAVHWRERPRESGFLAPADVSLDDLAVFDLLADPAETKNLAAVELERARGMLERLQQRVGEAREHAPDLVLGVGAGGAATLRHIGYMGGH